MQWTGGHHAGFSNTTGDLFLPVHDHYALANETVEERRQMLN
jgi:hypothetical protein